jgi:hypothetical protein
MHDKSVTRTTVTAVLVLIAALAPAWAQPSKPSPGGQSPWVEQTLSGTVGDSKCKGGVDREKTTPSSCAVTCTHSEGRHYVLVTPDAVYSLDGHKSDLDKFAGARATITGRADANTILVESVSSVK